MPQSEVFCCVLAVVGVKWPAASVWACNNRGTAVSSTPKLSQLRSLVDHRKRPIEASQVGHCLSTFTVKCTVSALPERDGTSFATYSISLHLTGKP